MGGAASPGVRQTPKTRAVMKNVAFRMMGKTIAELRRVIPVYDEVDVLVCGAGPAGFAATMAAVRAGARKQVVPSVGKWVQATREELMTSGVLAEDGAR